MKHFCFVLLFFSFYCIAQAVSSLTVSGKLYSDLKYVGQGAFGNVFEATGPDGQKYVLKFFQFKDNSGGSKVKFSPEVRRQVFEKDSKPLLASLGIDNSEGRFVEPIDSAFLDPKQVDGQAFKEANAVIVYPYRGRNLNELFIGPARFLLHDQVQNSLAEDNKTDLENAFNIFRELIYIIQMQARPDWRLICADIKPSNLLYDSSSRKMYVIDFGTSFKERSRTSENPLFLYNFEYAAPEYESGNLKDISVMSSVSAYGQVMRDIICKDCDDVDLHKGFDLLSAKFAKEQPENVAAISKLELLKLFIFAAAVKDPFERLKAFKEGPISKYFLTKTKFSESIYNFGFGGQTVVPTALTLLREDHEAIIARAIEAVRQLPQALQCDLIVKFSKPSNSRPLERGDSTVVYKQVK